MKNTISFLIGATSLLAGACAFASHHVVFDFNFHNNTQLKLQIQGQQWECGQMGPPGTSTVTLGPGENQIWGLYATNTDTSRCSHWGEDYFTISAGTLNSINSVRVDLMVTTEPQTYPSILSQTANKNATLKLTLYPDDIEINTTN